MAIYRGSRYEGVDKTGIKFADGSERVLLHDRRIFSNNDLGEDSIQHTVEAGEELDSIAYNFYGDDGLWWLIADVNDILYIFDVAPGDILTIPNPDIVSDLGFVVTNG